MTRLQQSCAIPLLASVAVLTGCSSTKSHHPVTTSTTAEPELKGAGGREAMASFGLEMPTNVQHEPPRPLLRVARGQRKPQQHSRSHPLRRTHARPHRQPPTRRHDRIRIGPQRHRPLPTPVPSKNHSCLTRHPSTQHPVTQAPPITSDRFSTIGNTLDPLPAAVRSIPTDPLEF